MICMHCGVDNDTVVKYRQNTCYEDEESNFVTLCSICTKINDEYWEERWAEYYSMLL